MASKSGRDLRDSKKHDLEEAVKEIGKEVKKMRNDMDALSDMVQQGMDSLKEQLAANGTVHEAAAAKVHKDVAELHKLIDNNSEKLEVLGNLKGDLLDLNRSLVVLKDQQQITNSHITNEKAKKLSSKDEAKWKQFADKLFANRKFVSDKEVRALLLAESCPTEQLDQVVSLVLKLLRNARSFQNGWCKGHLHTVFPGDGIARHLKNTNPVQKLAERNALCSRLNKNPITHTESDLEWTEILLCRYVLLCGQYLEYKEQHEVDVIAILKTSPFYADHIYSELKKDLPHLSRELAPFAVDVDPPANTTIRTSTADDNDQL